MSTSTSSASAFATPFFWERFWRTSGGIQFVVLFIIAYVIYGYQPPVGASADALVAFYDGNRTRILIAAVISGLNILNLMWFAAALRTALADAGQDGWGAAATASSAAFGALFFLLITVGSALAYSIARSGDNALTSGLNDVAWATLVLSSFPRAMLIMAGTFGLWRAGLDLECALRCGSRSPRACPAGRHHVDERWILGTLRRALALRLAHHRSRVDRGRQPTAAAPRF